MCCGCAVGPMLGLLMSLSLVFPLAMLVRGLVEEREKRLKETMAIMGLQARADRFSFTSKPVNITCWRCMGPPACTPL